MFKKKRNEDYQEYIDYESDSEFDNTEIDEQREYRMDSREPVQGSEWQNEDNHDYYQGQGYAEDLGDYSEYGTHEQEGEFGNQYVSRSQRRQQNTYNNDQTQHSSEYHDQDEFNYQHDNPEDYDDYGLTQEESRFKQNENMPRRTKYNARIDRFLNNGIIIVGVLLIIVLVIAFLL